MVGHVAKLPAPDAVVFARRASRADTLAAILATDKRKSVHAAALCNINMEWTPSAATMLAAVRNSELEYELCGRNGCSTLYRLQLWLGRPSNPLVARIRANIEKELATYKSGWYIPFRHLALDLYRDDVGHLLLPAPDYRKMLTKKLYDRTVGISETHGGRNYVTNGLEQQLPGLPVQQRELSATQAAEFLTSIDVPTAFNHFNVVLGMSRSASSGPTRALLSRHITWKTISRLSPKGVTWLELQKYGRSGQHVLARHAFEKLGDSPHSLQLFFDMLHDWEGTIHQLLRTVKAATS